MSDTQHPMHAYAVRNALRRKPTIIKIGEAKDRATIEAAVEAALEGTVTYRKFDGEIAYVYDGTKED